MRFHYALDCSSGDVSLLCVRRLWKVGSTDLQIVDVSAGTLTIRETPDSLLSTLVECMRLMAVGGVVKMAPNGHRLTIKKLPCGGDYEIGQSIARVLELYGLVIVETTAWGVFWRTLPVVNWFTH